MFHFHIPQNNTCLKAMDWIKCSKMYFHRRQRTYIERVNMKTEANSTVKRATPHQNKLCNDLQCQEIIQKPLAA